ncbi:MAG: hypothetical protein QOG10_1411, partial [Kribbellaceae bacterium]|nr:hypothetical protein [Kribbellaceae bacterium]
RGVDPPGSGRGGHPGRTAADHYQSLAHITTHLPDWLER